MINGGSAGMSVSISSGVSGAMNSAGINGVTGLVNGKFPGAFESSIDGFVKNGVMSTPTTPLPEFVPMVTAAANGMRGVNGINSMVKISPPNPLHAPISEGEDEISDVFTTMSVKDPMIAAPGYGRGRSRRSSAPVNMSVQHLWAMTDQGSEFSNGGHVVGLGGGIGGGGGSGDLGMVGGGGGGGGGMGGNLTSSRNYGSSTVTSFNGWSTPTTLAPAPVTAPTSQPPAAVSSIWSSGFQAAVTSQSSRPNSQTSSYSNSSEQGSSSLSAFSPIYSPTTTNTTNGFFSHEPVSSTSSLLTSNPLANSMSMAEQQQHSPAFKVYNSRDHVTHA